MCETMCMWSIIVTETHLADGSTLFVADLMVQVADL